MSSGHKRIKWRRNIAENFNRLSRVHKRYRQTTDDRRTDDDIANMKFTFAKNTVNNQRKQNKHLGIKEDLHSLSGRVVVSVSTSRSRDVPTSRSRDVPTSRPGLVSRKIVNVSVWKADVSVTSRSRPFTSGAQDQFFSIDSELNYTAMVPVH